MGRPSSYNLQTAAEICRLISEGENLNKICKLDSFPNQDTVYNWLDGFPEFAENYARARERRAETRVGRIDEIREKTLSGEIAPDVARVAIDVEKWQAGKEMPKRYGEKQYVEQIVDHKITIAIEDRRRIIEAEAEEMLQAVSNKKQQLKPPALEG